VCIFSLFAARAGVNSNEFGDVALTKDLFTKLLCGDVIVDPRLLMLVPLLLFGDIKAFGDVIGGRGERLGTYNSFVLDNELYSL
jgi:hypothetical protein